MNTPNPLIPQGSLLQSGAKTKSKINLVVFGVIAIHAVFFLGLLVQGCKRDDTRKAEIPPPTALPAPTADPYYNKYTELTNTPTPTPTPTPVPSSPATSAPVASLPVPGTSAPPAAPMAAPEMAPPSAVPAPMTPETPEAGTHEYVIAKGDSFYSIGKKHGIPMSAIAKANPGVDSAHLKIGQKIQLPGSAAPAPMTPAAAVMPEAASGFTSYTIKSGDTLSKIARKNHTTVSALRAANGLKTDRLYPGKKLKVPAAKTAAAPAAPAATAAPVMETPSAIPSPSMIPSPTATTAAPPASAIPNQ